MKPFQSRYETKLALFFLLIAATFGLLLRLMYVLPVPANYKFLLHTHSHIAMLGWMYFAIIFLLKKHLIPRVVNRTPYRLNLIITTISVFGMMFSFPFTGYALISIVSSSLFIFTTYHLCYLVFKDLKVAKLLRSTKKLINFGLIFLIISSIGPWSLSAIMASGNSGSSLYSNAIYFYLHFMYNGFLVFMLIALLTHHFSSVVKSVKQLDSSISILVFSGFSTVILSFLWNIDNQVFHVIGLVVALLQLYGFIKFYRSFDLEMIKASLKKRSGVFKLVIWIILLSFMAKLLLQILSSCPWIVGESIVNRDFVIGYIHLVFLGFISFSLFGLLFYSQQSKLLFKFASTLFLIGFIGTEMMLFVRGGFPLLFTQKSITWLLIVFSAFLTLGSLLYLILEYRQVRRLS